MAFAHELAVAMGRHPAGSGEMGVMDAPSTLGVAFRVEAEENLDGFAPISAVRRRIEQAQVELHVLTIVGREHRAFRGFIEKICLCHIGPLEPFLSIPEEFVNHALVASQQNLRCWRQ